MTEDSILAIINRFFPLDEPRLLLGRGDDCAVMQCHSPMAITTDIFVRNAHFRDRYFSAFDIGYKALAVNISDLAAAGAKPLGISIGLTLSGEQDEAWIEEFCRGMQELCNMYEICVTGGDLSKASELSVCITAWGELPQELPRGLRRGVAQKGDAVFMLGSAGLARAGLFALESGKSVEQCALIKKEYPTACNAHLHPIPLVGCGTMLADFAIRNGLQNRIGLMDVSDGPARDLPRLLASSSTSFGVDLSFNKDLHPELLAIAEKEHLDPGYFAFLGGEDYALLGTCPGNCVLELENLFAGCGTPFKVLGTVKQGDIVLDGKKISGKGFDHFG